MHLLRDFQAAIHHGLRRELSPIQWWRSVRGVKSFAVLSLRDPMPFLTAATQALFVMLSPRERN
jgi:hypothetical protein